MRNACSAVRGVRALARAFLACCFVVLALPAAAARWAEIAQPSFQRLGWEQGLPHEIATAIGEDSDGFLWVGTFGGVARWDGYRFRVYRADPRTPGALPDNVVWALHTDPAGRLWLGTGAGLVRYDAAADRFVRYPAEGGAGHAGLSHVNVNAIADDGSGGLWIGTEGGLDHLDPASGDIRAQPVAAPAVNALLLDRRGALWVATPAGLFRHDTGGAGFVAVALPAPGAAAQAVSSLAEDGSGRIWVGTARAGAYVIGRDGEVQAAQEPGGALADQQVTAIAEVRPGEVWLGTGGHGIVAIDSASHRTRRIRHDPTRTLSLAQDYVNRIHRDRSGLVWVAGARGLSQFDPRQTALLTLVGRSEGTEVSWVLPQPDGRIWLATHRSGVEILDPERGLVGAIGPDPAHPLTALPDDIVLVLERAPDGSVFIATKRGLYRSSADGRRVARVPVAGRDPAAPTWALKIVGGTLWIGGLADGLWQLDLASGRSGPAPLAAGQALTDQRLTALAPAPGGALWVGTRNGLNRYDPARGTVARIAADPNDPAGLWWGFISSLFVDRDQRLWVGTFGGGVQVLDRPAAGAPRFRHLTAAQGLSDDTVNAVIADDAGRIWASTDNGLSMIDPQTLAVRALNRADGVAFHTYWTNSAARTEVGELLFGGAGGVTVVRPSLLAPWRWQPPLVVTEAQVGGRRVSAVHAGDTLVVPADANSLAVEFAAIDYSAPERLRYAYKLEGHDADWVETDAQRRLAVFNRLPPGDYRLLLRGSNREGRWADPPLALAVRVLPAWHQTLWARAGMAAAALLAFALVLQRRTWALRRRQSELERKVSARTAELERVSEELKEQSRILEQSAITDPLTRLHNRRFLTEHIESELAASLRRGADPAARRRVPVDTDNVFYLIDIDHFKRVNDRHGHACGDAVLVQFGRRLHAALRESDHLVRWGGEEFLVVARDTDRAQAEELAERLRSAVADAPFLAPDGKLLPITCSLGFASAPFLCEHPRDLGWADVIQVADSALLAAKRAGRNTWVGISAGPNARRDGLLERIGMAAAAAVRAGEIVLASNRPDDAVLGVLEHRGPSTTISPGTP